MTDKTVMMAAIFFILLVLGIGYLQRKKIPVIQMLGRLVARLLVAAVALYLLNQFGSFIDFRLAINPITVAVTGILGIPGLLSLILIKYFIVQ